MFKYTYEAEFYDINPDNTVVFQVDLGFNVKALRTFYVYGVDIPSGISKNTSIREAGKRAMRYIGNRLSDAQVIYIESHKNDEDVYYSDVTFLIGSKWHNLSKSLVDADLAIRRDADAS